MGRSEEERGRTAHEKKEQLITFVYIFPVVCLNFSPFFPHKKNYVRFFAFTQREKSTQLNIFKVARKYPRFWEQKDTFSKRDRTLAYACLLNTLWMLNQIPFALAVTLALFSEQTKNLICFLFFSSAAPQAFFHPAYAVESTNIYTH